MIQLLMADLWITDNVVIQSISTSEWQINSLDSNSVIYSIAPILLLNSISKKRLKSDGLKGIVDGEIPVSAKVIVLQEINGFYTEVGRTNSSDGSWEINNLSKKTSIAIALKEGYNAGISSGLLPKD